MTRRTAEPSIQKQLASLLDDVNAQGYALTLLEGTSGRWPSDQTIRTGSLGLDMALGIGGWPRGRIVEIFGDESSGKTTLALHAVREAQAAGLLSVFIDAEYALDPNYAAKLGVDVQSVLVSQPNNMEQGIDLMNLLMNQPDYPVGLIVVDSVPAFQPRAMIEGEAESEVVGLQARRWSQNLPALARSASQSGTTIMLLNQNRDSMSVGGYGGPKKSQPGGKAIKFYCSVRVEIWRSVEGKKNDGADYQTCNLNLVKNKVGSPYRKAIFNIVPGEPIDWVEEILTQAEAYAVIQADTKYMDTVEYSKKGWYALPLKEGDLDLITQDDPTFSDDVKWEYTEDDRPVIQAYRWNTLVELLRRVPSLIESFEERILNSLNRSATFIHSEAVPEEAVEIDPEGVSEEVYNADEELPQQSGDEEQDAAQVDQDSVLQDS